MIGEFVRAHRLFAVLFLLMVGCGFGIVALLPWLVDNRLWLIVACLAYGIIYGLYLGAALAAWARMHDEHGH